jgi:hypothetical protein
MTQQTINIGSAANDGTGDPLRTSFVKTNANFTELYAYAAPFDAMAYNGVQLNGAMEVSQELGTTGSNVAGKYLCDGWRLQFSGTMILSGGIGAGGFPGFTSQLFLVTPTAQASLGANDFGCITQPIEGYRVGRLAWGTAYAQPITICFWSAHHRTGLYSGSVRNGANNRSYVFTYTQAAADVGQYNIITIPGDAAGTWATDNTTGLVLSLTMAAGTSITASAANAWSAGAFIAAPGTINAVAATTDAFRIGGVIVLPGNEGPSAARSPFTMRSFDQELITCQRYWRKNNSATGIGGTATLVRMNVPHPGMRVAPTPSVAAAVAITDVYASNPVQSAANVAIYANTADGGQYDFGNFTGLTVGRVYVYLPNSSPLLLDARM